MLQGRERTAIRGTEAEAHFLRDRISLEARNEAFKSALRGGASYETLRKIVGGRYKSPVTRIIGLRISLSREERRNAERRLLQTRVKGPIDDLEDE